MREVKRNRGRVTFTRRDFLKGTAYGMAGLTIGLSQFEALAHPSGKVAPFTAENPRSRVILMRHEAVVEEGQKMNPRILGEMLDRAITMFTGEKDALEAWKSLFRPEDTVGVKYTHCGWMRIHTEEALIQAIIKRLVDLGIPKNRIYAGDNGIPLKKCTALINVPSVKVHSLTGFAAVIKNYINFSNKTLSVYHHDGGSNLGETWLLPEVKGKTRLIIVDALRPYFGPGPQINPIYRWDYKGILLSTDPVAADSVCLMICQVKRNLFKGEEWLITPPPKSIVAADTKYNLGTSDPTKIKLIRLGWEKDVLI